MSLEAGWRARVARERDISGPDWRRTPPRRGGDCAGLCLPEETLRGRSAGDVPLIVEIEMAVQVAPRRFSGFEMTRSRHEEELQQVG